VVVGVDALLEAFSRILSISLFAILVASSRGVFPKTSF